VKNGFIEEVIKGWYIPSRPDAVRGESTAWYASFRRFAAAYLEARFRKNWTVSPEQSLSLHAGNRTVPRQLTDEHALMWQTHPRTKSSDGYPDAVKDKAHFLSDRFAGASFQSLPVDQSQKRLCEARCLDLLDDMNNWAGPKYLIAEGDTYTKSPDDETYPQSDVNYIKLDRLPRFADGWMPVLDSLRAGNFFVTSGEVLLHDYAIQGAGPRRTFVVDVDWTWPGELVELVWGDGTKTDRQILSATSLAPFSTHRYSIPFDATGKKWVRFAAWDSAGNGAFTQPVHL
jgi:hypothetical protein